MKKSKAQLGPGNMYEKQSMDFAREVLDSEFKPMRYEDWLNRYPSQAVTERVYEKDISLGCRHLAIALSQGLGKRIKSTQVQLNAMTDLKWAVYAYAYLKSLSGLVGSGHWRRIRNAISLYMSAIEKPGASEKVRKIPNLGERSERPVSPGRKRRMITVSNDDLYRIEIELAKVRKDAHATSEHISAFMTWAVYILCRDLMIRPCEAWRLTLEKNVADLSNIKKIELRVPPSKQTERGKLDDSVQRGLGRVYSLDLSDREELRAALIVVLVYRNQVSLNAVQARIRRIDRKLFPARKKRRFCLYTLRYRMASLIKQGGTSSGASDEDFLEMQRRLAIALGHRNIRSNTRYGSARASGGGLIVVPLAEMKADVEPRGDYRRAPEAESEIKNDKAALSVKCVINP